MAKPYRNRRIRTSIHGIGKRPYLTRIEYEILRPGLRMTPRRNLGSRFHGNDIISVRQTSKRGRGIVSSFCIAGGRDGRGRGGCAGA